MVSLLIHVSDSQRALPMDPAVTKYRFTPRDVASRAADAYNDAMPQEPPIPKELWDLIPAAAQAALLALLGNLQSEVTALRQQVADLTARLGQNSQNSSRPPSSDAPSVKRPPAREPSGRKRGAQPGHDSH